MNIRFFRPLAALCLAAVIMAAGVGAAISPRQPQPDLQFADYLDGAPATPALQFADYLDDAPTDPDLQFALQFNGTPLMPDLQFS
jgi:hypothetical protein